MTAERTVAVNLTARVNQYLTGIRAAEAETRKFANTGKDAREVLRKHGEAATKVGTAMLAVGGLAGVGLGLVVKASAEFGSKMAQLQTLSHATSDEMQQLSDAATTAGASFGFTATQVADAQIELQKAGVGVKDQLGGALKGALELAAAGQINVAEATQIATVAMTQFGLSAKNVPHLADLLAAGADKALGSVGDLGEALNNGGLQAHNMGLTIDDTVGTLAAFANSGLIGAEAGTQLRSMFIQIQKPTAAARATMDEYGISMYTAQGKFVGITALAGQLHDKLLPLPQAQRNAALATIFGSYAINGASVAMREGAKGIEGWISKVNDQGFAAHQAAGKLDSLAGSVQKLQAQFQTDLIKTGTGADNGLKGLVDGATAALKVYGDLPPVLQGVAVDAGIAVAGIGLLGGAALVAVPKLIALKLAIAGLDATTKGFLVGGSVAAGFVAIAAAAAYAEEKVAEFNYQQEHTQTKGSPSKKDQVAAAAATASHANPNAQSGMGLGMGLGDALDKQAEAQNKLTRAHEAGTAAESKNASAAGKNAAAHQTAAIETKIAATTAGLSSSSYTAASKALAKEAEAARLSADKMRLAGDYAGLLKLQLDRLNGSAISDAETQAAFAQALDSLTLKTKNGTAALTGNSRAAVENRGAVASLAAQGQQAVESYANQAKSQADLRAKFASVRSAMIDQVASITHNRAAAAALVDQYLKFPKHVDTKFTADTGTAKDKVQSLSAAGKAFAKSYEARLLADGHDATEAHKTAMAQARLWDRQHPTATIDGHNAPAESSIAKAMADAKRWDAQHPTAIIDADTSAALDKLAALENRVAALHGKTVTVRVHQVGTLANQGFAAGGAITGPGPKGKDSVPAMLAPGEHVLTDKDVDKLGGQAGVYRFRSALQSGLVQAFASGGAVTSAKQKVTWARQDLAYAQSRLKSATKAGKAARQHSVDLAKRRLITAEERLAALTGKTGSKSKAAVAAARKAAAKAAAERATVKAQAREDFVSTQRRATADNPIDPLSYVDQLRSMSRDTSGIYSSKQRKSFDAAANKYESTLVKLSDQSAKAAAKLKDLQDASTQMHDSIKSSIAGGYTLAGAATPTSRDVASGWVTRNGIRFQTTSTATSTLSAGSIADYYKAGAGTAGQFASALKQLAGKGINAALLAELAGMGTEQGLPIAQALLSASASQLRSINANYTAIGKFADSAGSLVADANYAKQIAAADAAADKITKQLASDGEKLRKLIASAFGLKGYAVGTSNAAPGLHWVGENGPELVGFNGGETVLTAARSRAWSYGSGRGSVQVAMPQSMNLIDADGQVIGRVRAEARDVAVREIHADAMSDAVLTYGGAA